MIRESSGLPGALPNFGCDDVEPIDVTFADLLARLSPPAESAVLRATAMLVSRERRAGHACVDLHAWAGLRFGDSREGLTFPAISSWTDALTTSGLAGGISETTPLVLDDRGRCYLRRYFEAEQRVANWMLAASENPQPAMLDAEDTVTTLFSGTDSNGTELQAAAVRLVLSRRFALISGGPGTGKTTTVARALALLLSLDRNLRIALATPTGKAAARLNESLQRQAQSLGIDETVRKRMTGLEAKTLHRLLGAGGRREGFRYDAANPLAVDIVILDEASMVDLLAMDALLAAIPARARVVLVGDKDQLASVDAGFVFGDLCESARPGTGTRLDGAMVELTRNWRFENHPGIEKLARAVRDCDPDGADAALADADQADVEKKELPRDAASLAAILGDVLFESGGASTPEQALESLVRVRVLAGTIHGPFGVETMNRAIEDALRVRGAIGDSGAGTFYRGRPVLVSVNDYGLELFNGDLGVCFPDEDGSLRVWFSAAGGGLRSFAPAMLPDHVTAWAMTVHKSQGSEFDRVILVLPEHDSPLLTRELVYTAITRAREKVTIYGMATALRAAVTTRATRTSGLRNALDA